MFHWVEVQNALFWEVASLEIRKSTCLVTWETSEKNKPHTTFSFPTYLILPHCKIAQYSFWQKTLNKAFPGSVEVIKDEYMLLKCKKFNQNNVLYKTTTPHVYQNMNIVLLRNLGTSWHLLGKKKHSTLYKSWLSPSRGDPLSPFIFPAKTDPC